MKVEFLVNTEINDGRQLFISATEFFKAKNDEEEFNSFAFATHALFSFYGVDDFPNCFFFVKSIQILFHAAPPDTKRQALARCWGKRLPAIFCFIVPPGGSLQCPAGPVF